MPHGSGHIKHGHARKGRKTSEYKTWRSMKARCNDPNHGSYFRYGKRGIKICARWNSFELFLADMGLKPTVEHSIDRIDNKGNYEPGNCRWATRREQRMKKGT